jgi:hypothetical protein
MLQIPFWGKEEISKKAKLSKEYLQELGEFEAANQKVSI